MDRVWVYLTKHRSTVFLFPHVLLLIYNNTINPNPDDGNLWHIDATLSALSSVKGPLMPVTERWPKHESSFAHSSWKGSWISVNVKYWCGKHKQNSSSANQCCRTTNVVKNVPLRKQIGTELPMWISKMWTCLPFPLRKCRGRVCVR